MRKWLLLAILGIVIFVAFRYREGVDGTLDPAPTCSNGGTPTGNTCSMVNGVAGNPICASGYSFTPSSSGNGTCVQLASESLDSYGYNSSGQINSTSQLGACNMYWDSAIAKWAVGNAATSQPDEICKQYAPSWITASMNTNTLLNSDNTPTQATVTKALSFTTLGANGQTYAQEQAASSGYSDILAGVTDANNGPLPPPSDEYSPPMDVSVSRSQTGPVFDSDGVFTGQSGIGQNTASDAASGIAGGSTYNSVGMKPRRDAYSYWSTSGGSQGLPPAPSGTNLPVKGPGWGGKGASSAPSSSSSSRPAPTLYGPNSGNSKSGSGSGSSKSNSNSTIGLPSFGSTGSDPNNAYAVTSRAPGDQDLIPNPYLQSTSYSLANGSQKTDPVPFLTDFSAFQS